MHTMSRTGLATLAAAASIASPLVATPALAAGAAAHAWAAYASSPSWVDQDDNLQWYVATGPISQRAVGKTATIKVTSPGTIDCANLGAGYGDGTAWVAVDPRRATCSGRQASWSFVVTPEMVGKEVSLNGWSAVGASTRTTVSGMVHVATGNTKVSSTATKAAQPAPVGPLTSLGTWQGKPVSIASGNLANQVWLGTGGSATLWTLPNGDVWHASLDGNLVNVWFANGTTELDLWQLDLATGAVTTKTLTISKVLAQGDPGFWVLANTSTGPYDQLYNWSGVQMVSRPHDYFGARGYIKGFTTTYAVYLGDGQTPTVVHLQPTDGSQVGTWDLHRMIQRATTDATGVDVTYYTNTGTATCRVQWGSSTCPGSWKLGLV